jgi:chromosome segregation ATPase
MNAINNQFRTTPKDPKVGTTASATSNTRIEGLTLPQIQKLLGRELTLADITNPTSQAKIREQIRAKLKAKQDKLNQQDENFRLITMTGPAQTKNLKGTVERYKNEVAQKQLELAKAKAKAAGARVGPASSEVQKLEAELAKAKRKLNDATYEYNVRKSEKDQAQANRDSLKKPSWKFW